MTDEPELYVPRPGGTLWKVLSYLIEHPTTELQRKDLVEKFGIAYNSVDMVMQLATSRGCLDKKRNSQNQLVWVLGLVKRFRLDAIEVRPEPEPSAPYQAIKRAEVPAKWTGNPKPSGPTPLPGARVIGAPAGLPDPALVKPVSEAKAPMSAPAPAPAKSMEPAMPVSFPPVEPLDECTFVPAKRECYVEMPLHLTPELIKAVQENTKTSFESKADGHHAIGWLHDAYQVMVEAQTKVPVPTERETA